MIFLLVIACALLFGLFCVAASSWHIELARNQERAARHGIELAAVKKVGKWYEDRVAELENETRALAGQLVASGVIAQHAMPLHDPEPLYDYAFDSTGLIAEKLDPRDVPLS